MADTESGSKAATAATILGAIALLLAVITVWLSAVNRGLQRQAAEGQQQLAKAQAMANLDNNLVQMLAKAAIEHNDGDIRALLERNGVQLKIPPGQPMPTPPGVPANGQ